MKKKKPTAVYIYRGNTSFRKRWNIWEILKLGIFYILHILYNYSIYKMYSPVKSCVTNLWRIFQSRYYLYFLIEYKMENTFYTLNSLTTC